MNINKIEEAIKVLDKMSNFIKESSDIGQALETAIDRLEKQLKIETENRIYRNDCFSPDEIALFEKIEKALGFKLYFWQKTYLITGNFRQGGFTTAECLRKLFGNKPIDFSERATSRKDDCERWHLLEIQKKLHSAGVETVPVLRSKKDVKDYKDAQRIKG